MISKRVAAVSLGLLTAVSSAVAVAQPGVTATSTPTAAPTHYVEGGLSVGGLEDLLTFGAGVDAGVQLPVSPLWLHAAVDGGVGGELFASGSGRYVRANAGLEARGCIRAGRACFFGGVDLGLTHGRFSGTTNFLGPATTMVAFDHFVAVPRIGVDVGDPHFPALRLRFSLDVPLDLDDVGNGGGAALSMGVGYGW